jgi:hypothetical protein
VALSAPSPGSTFIQPTIVTSSHPQGARNLSISSTGSAAPLGTPPETPNSATGMIPLKRDIEVPEQAVVEPSSSEDEPKSKKRRVAPTLILPADSRK